jgi:FixJ family two-component response regulator
MTMQHIPRHASEASCQNCQGTVFVIEDDPDMRRSLDKIFQEAGLAVRTFAGPHEFLESFRPEMIGCLVLDLELPGMSGLELHEALVKRGCQLPFIMITGYGDVPCVIEAFRRGAVDFIEKPFRSAQLVSRVQQAIDSMIADVRKQKECSEIAELCQSLTPRERELMDLLVAGRPPKQAAHEMGISTKTAYIHRARVLEKMQVETVLQLVQRVRRAADDN